MLTIKQNFPSHGLQLALIVLLVHIFINVTVHYIIDNAKPYETKNYGSPTKTFYTTVNVTFSTKLLGHFGPQSAVDRPNEKLVKPFNNTEPSSIPTYICKLQ